MVHWYEGAAGQRLAADLYGPDEGTPVLLLGGMGQTRHSWRRAAQRIADGGRRAITLDLRGHGESDRAVDGEYGYTSQATDIAGVARAVGRPLVIAGNSLGGKIALASAGICGSDVVAGIVMVDAVPRSRPAGISAVSNSMQMSPSGFASPEEAAMQVAAGRGETVASGAADRLRRNMRREADGRWYWHWDALAYRDPRQNIGLGRGTQFLESIAGDVKVPAMLAWCELSEVVDQDGVAALRALMPQLEVGIIPGARHLIVGDQNDIFADALLGFLARNAL
jgi:pimeloyl-ACP methyl ester carboxylesterase